MPRLKFTSDYSVSKVAHLPAHSFGHRWVAEFGGGLECQRMFTARHAAHGALSRAFRRGDVPAVLAELTYDVVSLARAGHTGLAISLESIHWAYRCHVGIRKVSAAESEFLWKSAIASAVSAARQEPAGDGDPCRVRPALTVVRP